MSARAFLFLLPPLAALIALAGCSDDVSLPTAPSSTSGEGSEEGVITRTLHAPPPPADLVTVDFAGESVTFWPYTGASFDGEPVDPFNLLFVGPADPVQIRAALLALDGDRTGYGFPDEYPFNATWSDAIGDVQTTYAEGADWLGSVIQLQLGAYDPIRWHLRLFRTNDAFGGTGVWTIGGAHFEVRIPGTADHESISWERAEEIVVLDLVRSGLLDPFVPYVQTGVINATPFFGEIMAPVYNGLPENLKQYIGGPLGTVTEPVPIPSDGKATIVNLAGTAPVVPGALTQSFALTYELPIPKPFCSAGPEDWVLVTGPVNFTETVEVDAGGQYVYHSSWVATLTVTPWDIVNGQPIGDPYPGEVSNVQHGMTQGASGSVSARNEMLGLQPEGTEIWRTWLKISTPGPDSYRVQTRCL